MTERVYTSRRLWVAIIIEVLTFILQWFEKVDPAAWQIVTPAVAIAYFGNRALVERSRALEKK